MAVKVLYKNGTASTVSHDSEHEDGAAVVVRDGHLFVNADGTGAAPIAIYAPGFWVSAEVTK